MSGTDATLPEVTVTATRITPTENTDTGVSSPVLPATNLQWLRTCSLIVADNSGNGLELGSLRIVFKVVHGIVSTPKRLSARIYNLSDATMNTINNEFTQVRLQTGWVGSSLGTLFNGQIKQKRIGRENSINSFLDVFAADGDQAFNFGIINTTLAAGSTDMDVVNACINSLSQYNIKVGYISPNLSTNKSPRARVLHGMVRDILHDVAKTNNMAWQYHDGMLDMVQTGANEYIPGSATVLNSASGMIGVPEQTLYGIRVQALINYNFGYGRVVQINNKDILAIQQELGTNQQGVLTQNAPSVTTDGFYKILYVDHTGDTRGNQWYSELTCLSIDPSAQGSLKGAETLTPQRL